MNEVKNMSKTIRVETDVWKRLMKRKIEEDRYSLNEIIKELLENDRMEY